MAQWKGQESRRHSKSLESLSGTSSRYMEDLSSSSEDDDSEEDKIYHRNDGYDSEKDSEGDEDGDGNEDEEEEEEEEDDYGFNVKRKSFFSSKSGDFEFHSLEDAQLYREIEASERSTEDGLSEKGLQVLANALPEYAAAKYTETKYGNVKRNLPDAFRLVHEVSKELASKNRNNGNNKKATSVKREKGTLVPSSSTPSSSGNRKRKVTFPDGTVAPGARDNKRNKKSESEPVHPTNYADPRRLSKDGRHGTKTYTLGDMRRLANAKYGEWVEQLKSKVLVCQRCGAGFRGSDAFVLSCRKHSDSRSLSEFQDGKFACCGYPIHSTISGLERYHGCIRCSHYHPETHGYDDYIVPLVCVNLGMIRVDERAVKMVLRDPSGDPLLTRLVVGRFDSSREVEERANRMRRITSEPPPENHCLATESYSSSLQPTLCEGGVSVTGWV